MDFEKMVATIRANGVYNGIMYLLLLNMSAHLTKEIGMAPGGEFRVAYKEVGSTMNISTSKQFHLFFCYFGIIGEC